MHQEVIFHGVSHTYHCSPSHINSVYSNMWLVVAVGSPPLSGLTG